jgi:hypothetical protein
METNLDEPRGFSQMKNFGLFLLTLISFMAQAETATHVGPNTSFRSVLESLQGSTSGFEAYKSVNDFAETCRSVKAAVSCAKNALTGLFSDGLMGDVDTFKFIGKESARLALSTSIGGQFALKLLNKKTTADKIREHVEKLGPNAQEALPILARLATDPFYQLEIAKKVSGILGAFIKKSADEGLNLKCDQIQDPLCRVLGQIGYEALASLVLTAVTIEVGGAGGFAKIALLLPKLAKQFPKLKPLIQALYKLADDLKGGVKATNVAGEAPGARFARARERVKNRSRFVSSDAEALRRAELKPLDRLKESEELLGHAIGGSGPEVAAKLDAIHRIGQRPGDARGGFFRDPVTNELRTTLKPQQIAEKKKLAAELGLKPEETEKLLDRGYLGGVDAAPANETGFLKIISADRTLLGGIPNDFKVPENLEQPLKSYLEKVKMNQSKLDEAPAKIKALELEIDDLYYEFNSQDRVKALDSQLKNLQNPLNLLIRRGSSDARAFEETLRSSPVLAAHVKEVEKKVVLKSNQEMLREGYEIPKEILNVSDRLAGSASGFGGSVMGIAYRRELPDGQIESVQKIYDRVSGKFLGEEKILTNPKTGALDFPERGKMPSHGGRVSCQVCHMQNVFFKPETREGVIANNQGIADRISKGK